MMKNYGDALSDLSKLQYEYDKMVKRKTYLRNALAAIAAGNYFNAQARAQIALERDDTFDKEADVYEAE